MGLGRVLLITGSLMAVMVMFDVLPGTLPHPACHHDVRDIEYFAKPGSLVGDFSPNTALQSSRRLLEGQVRGSESITVSPSGQRLFLADKYGWIFTGNLTIDEEVSIQLEDERPIVRVPGRPLGIHATSEDRLLVCDSLKGLLEVDLTAKSHRVLTNRADTRLRERRTSKIVYANDLDVGPDGIVYFTDSTDIPVDKGREGFYSTMRSYVLNVLEGRATGRLLAYDPVSNKTKELMSRLWYANGVAVSKDGSFVTVVETNAFRVHRYWLKGPYVNTKEILIDGLPGMADGISTASDGGFWIALVCPPSLFWKFLKFKIVRLAMAWLTEVVTIPLRKWGYVVKISPEGKVLQVLSDVQGGFVSGISCAVEQQGKLWMGNLFGDYISVFDLGLLSSTTEDTTKDEL